MLYYIISLLISVVADEILYLFYKWLSRKQPDNSTTFCLILVWDKAKAPRVATSGGFLFVRGMMPLHNISFILILAQLQYLVKTFFRQKSCLQSEKSLWKLENINQRGTILKCRILNGQARIITKNILWQILALTFAM